MKKQVISISTIIIIIVTTVVFYSCRKKRLSLNEQIGMGGNQTAVAIVPPGEEPQYVENQLKWIARALPMLAANGSNFKSEMHNAINSTLYKIESNAVLQSKFITSANSLFDYNNLVYQTVNLNFLSNNYDSSYFFGFEFEDCVHSTIVRFNKEANAANYSTKMLVATAEYESMADTIISYYYNATTYSFDSLELHADNEDDYYIWIVDAENHCFDDPATFLSYVPENHCGDGNCQAFYGETNATCPGDCPPPPPGSYTLILQEIQHLADRRMKTNLLEIQDQDYHETAFGGKYDIYFPYVIVSFDPSAFTDPRIKDQWYISGIVRRAFRKDLYTDIHGYSTNKMPSILLTRLKPQKGEVLQEKENTAGKIVHNLQNTVASTKTIAKVLCNNFDPLTDRIYSDMLEWDRKAAVRDDKFIPHPNSNPSFEFVIKYRQREAHSVTNGALRKFGCPYFFGYVQSGWDIIGPLNNTPSMPAYWLSGTNIYGPGSFFMDLTRLNNTSDRPFIEEILGVLPNNEWFIDSSEMRIRYVLLPNP